MYVHSSFSCRLTPGNPHSVAQSCTILPGCPRLGTVLTCCLSLRQVVVHWTGWDRLVGFIPTNMLVCRAKGDVALILKNPLPSHKSLHYLIYLLTHSQDLSHVRHATLPHLSISFTYFRGSNFNRFFPRDIILKFRPPEFFQNVLKLSSNFLRYQEEAVEKMTFHLTNCHAA